MQVHDAIVRAAIERHDGHVFATDGDGFRAASPRLPSAAAAAVESQRALGADTAIGFAVRMGLHTGEAIERGRPYFGTEVNRAARLMALGHGGQVLVSDTTEVLLRSRLSLRPLGEHLLRGLRGRIAVFQVVAEGLRPSSPCCAASTTSPATCRVSSARSSVARSWCADVAESCATGLVTLTGVGGVGKTRMAFEVGAELAGEFPDGVWIVELAGVADPG